MNKFLQSLGFLLLLGGCDVRTGKDETEEKGSSVAATRASASPAAGKSQEGELSIKAPGFDMKVKLPKGLSEQAAVDGDNDLVYPGSSIGGMHIEAGAKKTGSAESGVEIRFSSGDPLEKVAAWYRDPARREGFSITREGREGDSLIIYGAQKDDGDPFKLQLTAAAAGGAEAKLTLSDRR